MSKTLFERVLEALMTNNDFFAYKVNAARTPGIRPLIKVTAALRMLAYGASADSIDENLELSERTTLKSLRCFCESVIENFGDEYLREPTDDDISLLLGVNAKRGFVGMLGSIDCMHWQWNKCPTAFAGQYTSKEKKPTVILEAWADQDLWIWHCLFGAPGSILHGVAPTVSFAINGSRYSMAYLLADGIYPDWAVFVKSISNPLSAKEKYFAKIHEAARKDVERAFGVLIARWRILDLPCRFWDAHAMGTVMKTCIILHNMIMEEQRGNQEANDFLFDRQPTRPLRACL
ncbi:hypothetical protein AeMF1_006771 [Aphanomyces euteiches]|nr:hypothetical protein AeMF1_006771 [Aphanomyces euteiches]